MGVCYTITRFGLIVVTVILIILNLVGAIQVLTKNSHDVTLIVDLFLLAFLNLFGVYASWYHLRDYLVLYAVMVLILTVLGLVYGHYLSGLNIILIILSLLQAELIREGQGG